VVNHALPGARTSADNQTSRGRTFAFKVTLKRGDRTTKIAATETSEERQQIGAELRRVAWWILGGYPHSLFGSFEGAARRGKFKSRNDMPYYERRATAKRLREIARYIEASDDERATSSPWPVYGPCF
jgi:hypothetical protein